MKMLLEKRAIPEAICSYFDKNFKLLSITFLLSSNFLETNANS